MSTNRNELAGNRAIYQGQNKTIRVTVRGPDGGQLDITGATVVLTVKRTTDDLSSLISKTTATPAEGAVTVPLKGKAELYLIPADTLSMTPAKYVYDVWVTLSGGETYPVVRPTTFEVRPRV